MYHAHVNGHHRYSVTEHGLSYTYCPEHAHTQDQVCSVPAVKAVPWSRVKSFSHDIVWPWRKQTALKLKVIGSRPVRIWLKGDEMENFLRAMLSFWKKEDSIATRRAVFHYATEEKSFWWIWLIISIFAVGGLGTSLAGDGFNSLQCSEALRTQGQLIPAKVVQTKKDRRGNINWLMEFTTPDGRVLSGKRVPVAPPGYDIPTDRVAVVYAHGFGDCWDLSKSADEPQVNWAQRRFLTTLALGFGVFFTLTSIVLTIISFYKLGRERPYKELVRRAALAAGIAS